MKITIDRAVVEQALEALLKSHTCPLLPDDCEEAITALRAALAQQAEPVATHRIDSWGFCGVCRHDRIPGEGCARQECPDSPQQAEPVEPVAWVHTDAHNPKVRFLEWTQQAKGYRGDWIKTPLCNCAPPRQSDPQVADRLARHGIPMPGDPK